MKRWIWIMVAGLLGLTFSCQKDSLSGVSNEELSLRGGPGDGLVIPVMRKFQADYQLYEVEALPFEGEAEGLKPPKGYVGRMYGMAGNVSFMGQLEPGMSWEVHYLPPYADLDKDTVDAWVLGQFLGGEAYETLRYVGECTWYPDGKRESSYRFFYGAGRFEDVHGWMTGIGQGWNEGVYMKFEAKGEIFSPLRSEAATHFVQD